VERLGANHDLCQFITADGIDRRGRCCSSGNSNSCGSKPGWHEVLGSKLYDQRSSGDLFFGSVVGDGRGRRVYIDGEWLRIRFRRNGSVERS
jgi:hypothetical protein